MKKLTIREWLGFCEHQWKFIRIEKGLCGQLMFVNVKSVVRGKVLMCGK